MNYLLDIKNGLPIESDNRTIASNQQSAISNQQSAISNQESVHLTVSARNFNLTPSSNVLQKIFVTER
ncbi:hypothetical protein SC889_08265 [Legionella pneumophila serogroup 1]